MDVILMLGLSCFFGGILGYHVGYHFGAQSVLRQWRESLQDRKPRG